MKEIHLLIGGIMVTMVIGFIIMIVVGVQHEVDRRDRLHKTDTRIDSLNMRIEENQRKIDSLKRYLQQQENQIDAMFDTTSIGAIPFTTEGDVWMTDNDITLTGDEYLTIQGDTSRHVYKRTGQPMEWRCIDHGDTILFDPHMKLSNL